MLASIWLVAIALTGYCAADLRSWAHGSAAREASELIAVTDDVQAFGDATGLADVRDRLERLRERLYKGSEAVAPAVPPQRAAPAGPSPAIPPAQPAPAPATPHAIHRALVIGASSIQFDLGIALEQQLTDRGVTVKRVGRAATGLTQPEILNWAAKLEALLDGFAADTVIINFGGNDAMAIKVGRDWLAWGHPRWAAAYGERVADLVARCARRGALAVVIGMPVMRLPSFSQRMRELNQITRQYTEAAGGVYLSQWDYSTTPDGRYRVYLDVDGQRRPMRNEDGIHYSAWGAAHVARQLIGDLAQQFAIGAGPP